MIGYLIVVAEITDRNRFADYVQALPPVYQHFGGEYLAIAGPSQARRLGAAAEKSIVISAWSSLDQIKQFWHSEAYQQVAKKRAGTGQFQVCAIAGSVDARQFPGQPICLSFTDRGVTDPNQNLPVFGSTLASGIPEILEGDAISKQVCLRLIAHNDNIDALANAWRDSPNPHWLVNSLKTA
jgi:uncharacterized protein (DUF1330 family)